jgi:hypothetical protein
VAETPVQRFLALLADGFASKQVYVEALKGGPPGNGDEWGWEMCASKDQEIDEHRELQHNMSAQLLGRIEGGWLLLYPEVTYQYVSAAARTAGQVFPVDRNTLLVRLDEDGLIATAREKGGKRRTVKQRIGDRTPRVIKLSVAALDTTPPGEGIQVLKCSIHVPPGSPRIRFGGDNGGTDMKLINSMN